MKKSKFHSMLLVFVMLLTCSVNTANNVFAVSDNPTITVGTVEGNPNDEVAVTVSLSNNPGVCSIRLAVSYDSKLTLTAVENGNIMSDAGFGKQLSANPYYVTWDESLANNDNTKNGTLVTLTFKISESASAGDLPVSVSYRVGEIYNLELDDVVFDTISGTVSVINFEPGDANGDNVIDSNDLVVLKQVLLGVTDNVFTSADCNGDNIVDIRDLIWLKKWLVNQMP